MKVKGLIIAGSYHQFLNYLREKKLKVWEYIYICDWLTWRGHYDIPIRRVGTWWENPMAKHIHKIEAIVHRNAYLSEEGENK